MGLFPPEDQIKWALHVETKELGITAGLQDRVVQVLEGCIEMHFDKDRVEKAGNGEYISVDVSLFLAYSSCSEDISLMCYGRLILTELGSDS